MICLHISVVAGSGFDSLKGQCIIFFSETSRRAVRLARLPVEWVPTSLLGRVERPGRLGYG